MTATRHWHGRRVLVTGADGFIGSHLTERLVCEGAAVRAFVLYNSFSSWGWLDKSPAKVRDALDVRSGDIRDAEQVADAVQGCDVVFRLAALISVPYSFQAPRSFVDTNVGGTLNVLEAARRAGGAKVVHTSTSEVYGDAERGADSRNSPFESTVALRGIEDRGGQACRELLARLRASGSRAPALQHLRTPAVGQGRASGDPHAAVGGQRGDNAGSVVAPP